MTQTQGMQGGFTRDSIPALLQYFAMLGGTGRLALRFGQRIASIYLESGRVVDAQCGTSGAMQAFHDAMAFERGDFRYVPNASSGKVTIDQPVQQLLLIASHEQDVRQMQAPEAQIGPDSLLTASASRNADSVSLDGLMLRLLILLDGQRPVNAAWAAQQLGTPFAELLPVLRELARAGLVHVQQPEVAPLAAADLAELERILVAVVGPVAGLLLEDAAEALGVSVAGLEAKHLRRVAKFLERNLTERQAATLRQTLEPLLARIAQQ